ncbi:hypothetical protein H0E87_024102 [Populus deltoides]|uniref:RRM domain-containing protein n=1 Tax=Populus deltoides TaxID=3696 RepID=A0A8T2X508_POPDE|nr:hypothetical protein H0E87_024102 [Populus deltoides]
MPPRTLKRGAAAAAKKRTVRKVQNQQQPETAEEALNLEEKQTVVDKKPVVMEEEESVVVEDKLFTEEKKDGEDEIEADLVANGSASLKKEDEFKESVDEYEKDERLDFDDNEPEYEHEEYGGVDYDDKEIEQEDVQEVEDEVEEEHEEKAGEEEEGNLVEEELEEVPEELEGEEDDEHAGEEVERAEMADVEEEDEHHEVFKERRKRKEFEIFVGGLDKDATEDDLRKVFSRVGEVAEARVMMNPQTKKNKGFAFLRFATVEQAKRAVTELKNPVINGKQCGVTPSQDSDTLFLGNICKTWTKEALKEKLKHYGVENVEDLTLVEDSNNLGMNRGFAFLEFSSRSDAMNAFKRLQKRDVLFGVDRPAKVSFADSFIGPGDEIMAQAGLYFTLPVVSCVVDQSALDFYLGFCLIQYSVMYLYNSSLSLVKIMLIVAWTMLGGHDGVIFCALHFNFILQSYLSMFLFDAFLAAAATVAARENGAIRVLRCLHVKTLFIDGLPASWDEDRFRVLLKKYGNIEKIELARNMPSARRKDFGFVTFDTHDAAVACAKSINNVELGEGDNKVKVRARLSRPLQRGKGKHASRDDFRSGHGASRVVRGPWVRPLQHSYSTRAVRGIATRAPPVSLKRSPGLRERRPPLMSMPARSRPLAPHSRSYDRRPPPPSYPKGTFKREYVRHEELPSPRSRPAVDYGPRSVPERRPSYREDYSSRGTSYSDLPRSTSRTSARRAYADDGYNQRYERPPPSYHEGRSRDYDSVAGSKRPYSAIDDIPPRYADAGARHSRPRLDYELGSRASQYGDAYSDRLGRSAVGYGGSRNSISSQDSHGMYSSRQGMGYGGSYGGSDGGIYQSSYSGDYMSRGGDVGGSSYSSMYSSRGMGSSNYMGTVFFLEIMVYGDVDMLLIAKRRCGLLKLVLIVLTVLDDVDKCNRPLYVVEKVELRVLQNEKKFDSQVFGAFRGMVMVASGSLDLLFTKTSKVLQCLVGISCDFSQCSDYYVG